MNTDKHALGVIFSGPTECPFDVDVVPGRPSTLTACSKLMKARWRLMGRLAIYIQRRGFTLAEAAARLEVSPGRISDLLIGRISRFTAGDLVNMCIRVGIAVDVTFDDGAPDGANGS